MRRLLVSPRRPLGASLLLLAFLALVGCGSGKKPTGSVTGKVTYKSQPVASGFVNFINPTSGIAAQGKIDESGSYKLEGAIDVGSYKVYLQPPLPEQLPPGTPVKPKPPFNIPKKYLDASSTPLSKDVKAGANDIAIELAD